MTEANERVVRVGCAGLPPGTAREAYFRRLPLLEVEGPAKPAVLRKWQRAGAHTLLLRVDKLDLAAAAWRELLDGYDALKAEALVLQTPPSFSPSAANREAMKRFFGEVAGDPGDRVVCWEPRGTWEPLQAARLCLELGILHAYDPLLPDEEGPPPAAEEAYYRIYGLGLQRNRISDDNLATLAERVALHARAWVVFATGERWRDAQKFAALWSAFADEAE